MPLASVPVVGERLNIVDFLNGSSTKKFENVEYKVLFGSGNYTLKIHK